MRNPFKKKGLHFPDTGSFTTVPSFALFDSGEIKLSSSYGQIFETVASVNAVVSLIARSLSQVTLRAYQRTPDGPRELDPSNRLVALIRQSGVSYALARDMAVWGESLHLMLGSGQYPTQLVRLNPESTTVEGRGSLITGYRVSDVVYAPDDVLHVRTPSVTDELRGLSPLQALKPLLQEDAAALSYRLQTWTGAQPGTWVERSLDAPEWSDVAKHRFQEDMKKWKGGDIAVLDEGMKIGDSKTASPKDAEYLNAKRFTYDAVCSAYGIPSACLSATTSDRSADAAARALFTEVLSPMANTICEAIGEQLIPRMMGAQAAHARIYVAYDLEERLRPGFAAADVWSSALAAGYLTIDEVRGFQNLPPLSDPVHEAWVKLRDAQPETAA